jgi:hypothetical protein
MLLFGVAGLNQASAPIHSLSNSPGVLRRLSPRKAARKNARSK